MDEAVGLAEGLYSITDTSCSCITAAERQTARITKVFEEFQRAAKEQIAALTVQLEADQASTVDSARKKASMDELRTQSAADGALLVGSHRGVIRGGLVVTASCSGLASLEVPLEI